MKSTSADDQSTRPSWADEVAPASRPTDAATFFGRASGAPPAPATRPDPVDLNELARTLGPLLVDGIDLAPDVIRLLGDIMGAR